MFFFRYLVLIFGVTLLENTLGMRLAIGPVRPDLSLALVVYAGLGGDWRSGVIVGFVVGLLRGVGQPAWLGLDSLLLSLVGFAAASTSQMVNRNHPLVQGVLIFLLFMVYDLLRGLVIMRPAVGQALLWWITVSPAAALYTGILVPAGVALLPRVLCGGMRRAIS